ncbi:MAG: hypothetical protein ACLSUZ_02755 [Bifidobacterium pseudocatenulatum]
MLVVAYGILPIIVLASWNRVRPALVCSSRACSTPAAGPVGYGVDRRCFGRLSIPVGLVVGWLMT